jgi:branched-chain amino acid aminotransferase
MNDVSFLNYNGKIHKSGAALISADNRSFRYGDGFFETMKMINGKIILAEFHFERLFASLETLRFEQPKYFTKEYLSEQIIELTKKNQHKKIARVRLTVFRGNGGLYDTQNNSPNYIIQTWNLNPESNSFNENGLVIHIFKDAKKACDIFSHIKSNNCLAYAMAALWAKENRLNDALLLNSFDRIADATIANVFIVKDGIIKTPSLKEGCVSGTIRKYLLQSFQKENIDFEESQIAIEDIFQASEIFLTNAIFGIKWVKQLGDFSFQNDTSAMLHKKFIIPLF